MKNMKKELTKDYALKHSTSHLMASAVKELYPKVKVTIGPPTDEGFYYDFDNLDISDEDLKKIEKKMRQIAEKNLEFSVKEISKVEAKKLLKNEPYKLELLKDIEGKITFYTHGNFTDLCEGPHVKSTKEIKHFKLMSIAGAYWRGNSKNKMLTRIYGVVFNTEKELKLYLELLEEAKKRDHKKIGKEMRLFTFSPLVGRGLPLWLPKGEIIKREIENFAIETEEKAGYVRVSTPHLAKKELYLQSGHLPYFEEDMYPSMKMDDGIYYLKAMNCPHHHLIYNSEPRSYKDLPLRIAEYGTCYRNELSGTLAGLLRVRMLSMNDAHIYCTKDQIEDEIKSTLELIKFYFETFGFNDYYFRLSLWDPKNKDKYIHEPKNWEYTQEILRKLLKKLKVNFVEVEGEAAFYGPKIDVQFKTVLGREESMSTIQLDFAAKTKFDLKYADKENKENSEVFVIHRAPLSVHERFIAFLIEHYSGNFPLWLSPEQVRILTITDRSNKYAEDIYNKLKEEGFRVDLDTKSHSISKKVREAQVAKVNYMITIGDKEIDKKTLAIRTRDGKVKFDVKLDTFIKDLKKEIQTKSR